MVISCYGLYYTRFVKGISFHKFSLKDPNLCEKWLIATKHIHFITNKFSQTCSNHFKIDDFKYQQKRKKLLKKSVVPYIFDFAVFLKSNSINKRNQILEMIFQHMIQIT